MVRYHSRVKLMLDNADNEVKLDKAASFPCGPCEHSTRKCNTTTERRGPFHSLLLSFPLLLPPHPYPSASLFRRTLVPPRPYSPAPFFPRALFPRHVTMQPPAVSVQRGGDYPRAISHRRGFHAAHRSANTKCLRQRNPEAKWEQEQPCRETTLCELLCESSRSSTWDAGCPRP